MRQILGRTLLAATALLGVAGSAGAQDGVFRPGAMRPPPSAAEPRGEPRSEPAPRRGRPRPAAAGTSGASASSDDVSRTGRRSGSSGTGSYSDRIDTRGPPATRGSGIQLEDDPRAVQPTIQGGRPGVGMKF